MTKLIKNKTTAGLGTWIVVMGLALTISSMAWAKHRHVFSTKVDPQVYYMVYNGTGNTNQQSSFTKVDTQPSACEGESHVCWFRVVDTDDDGTISTSEFQSAFDNLDSNSNGTLDDESPVSGYLSIRD